MSVGPDVAVAAAMMKGQYLDRDMKLWERDAALNLWVNRVEKGLEIWRGHGAMEQAIRDENP